MLKRIGILGGISPASTLEYYRRLVDGYYQRQGDYYYPEIIYSLDFQRFSDYEDTNAMAPYIAYIADGLNRLEQAGADVLLMAANSPHSVFAEVSAQVETPILSIVTATARAAATAQLNNVLLLGIDYTMRADFYPREFKQHGIEMVVPSAAHRTEVNRIIFDELSIHLFKEGSRQTLLDIISGYQVDGVIVGCTELPLILKQDNSNVPLLDTIDLHINAALDHVLGDASD
jgi:aspartate racemase